jgi:hypothetical protein
MRRKAFAFGACADLSVFARADQAGLAVKVNYQSNLPDCFY